MTILTIVSEPSICLCFDPLLLSALLSSTQNLEQLTVRSRASVNRTQAGTSFHLPVYSLIDCVCNAFHAFIKLLIRESVVLANFVHVCTCIRPFVQEQLSRLPGMDDGKIN